MEIHIIESLRDNYIYVLINPQTKQAAVVDPSEAKPVLSFLRKENLELTHILNTHHHHDHVGGNLELAQRYPQAKIMGGKNEGRIPAQSHFLIEDNLVELAGTTARVIDIPGHTRGHIAYYFEKQKWLFSGDTIFGGTCGAIFEGTPQEMFASLSKISALPPDTQIWCSHEYTSLFMNDAIRLDPQNQLLRERAQRVSIVAKNGVRTIPLSLGEELDTNPYLRSNIPSFAAQFQEPPGLPTFLKVIAMG